MSKKDKAIHAVSTVIASLKDSEYGTDEYHLAYKALVGLLISQIDISWGSFKNDFTNKQELLFFDIIDCLVDVNHDDAQFSETPEVISKIIRADSEFIEYCKAIVGVENSYPFEIKFEIKHKLNLIREAVSLCQ